MHYIIDKDGKEVQKIKNPVEIVNQEGVKDGKHYSCQIEVDGEFVDTKITLGEGSIKEG